MDVGSGLCWVCCMKREDAVMSHVCKPCCCLEALVPGLRLPDGAGLAQRGGRRGRFFITAEQREVEEVSRLCRAGFPLLPVCRFLCLVCHWCKPNRLQPWSRADKSEAGAQGSEDVPPSPEPALASPSSRGPHSMFFPPPLPPSPPGGSASCSAIVRLPSVLSSAEDPLGKPARCPRLRCHSSAA